MLKFCKILAVMLAMLAAPSLAQTPTSFTPLGTYGVPGQGYPAFVYPIDVPVFITGAFNTAIGGGDNSKIIQNALNKLNSFGSVYRYYYGGVAIGFNTCGASYSLIKAGTEGGPVSAFCGAANFVISVGANSDWAVINPTVIVSAINALESQIIWAFAANVIPGTLNAAEAFHLRQGGLSARPIVAHKTTFDTIAIDAPPIAKTPRTLGFSSFTCVDVQQIDGYVCIEGETMGNRAVRLTRTSFTNPGPTTSTCLNSTQVNCGNDIALSSSLISGILTATVAYDSNRKAFWASDGWRLWSSTDMGLSWTQRVWPGGWVRAMTYSPLLDSVVMAIDNSNNNNYNLGTRFFVLGADWLTVPPANPMLMKMNVLYNYDLTTSLEGLPETQMAIGDNSLACDGTYNGEPLCTFIYTDGMRNRNLRRMRFVPDNSAGTALKKTKIVSMEQVSTVVAASGVARINCAKTPTDRCDSLFVLTGADPDVPGPLSWGRNVNPPWAPFTDTQFPHQASSVLYNQNGVESVIRKNNGLPYLIGRHDVYEYF